MAHQSVYLIQNEVFGFSSLKGQQAQMNTAITGKSGLVAKILDFAHPRTGEATKFMMVNDDLLELQAARPTGPQELGSFFIDQSVQEDGSVRMASRIDPLFLLLPVLCKYATKWCPLDQALAEGDCGMLKKLRHLDAKKLCDFNDRLGPDDILIRLNEDLVMSWLVVKVERATKRFVEVTQAGQGAEEIGGEGFASGFTAIATTPDARHKGEIEAECRQQALEAVCEYLAEDWGAKLAGRFSVDRSVLFGGKSTAAKKRKAVWEESAEVDRNFELSHSTALGGTKTKLEATAAVMKTKQPASHAERSLAKVNKKGMKSIASFFGK